MFGPEKSLSRKRFGLKKSLGKKSCGKNKFGQKNGGNSFMHDIFGAFGLGIQTSVTNVRKPVLLN